MAHGLAAGCVHSKQVASTHATLNHCQHARKKPHTEPSEQPDATGAFTSLVSDARGVQLFVRHWPAASGAPPAGMVLVSHGYTG